MDYGSTDESASILGLSHKEIADKIDDIIDFSELREFIHSIIKSDSSGMMARLGFSISTQVDPEVLLIDEIPWVGDEHFIWKCEEKMGDSKSRALLSCLFPALWQQ